jgi:GNAT superfamily N-acetyltransferase
MAFTIAVSMTDDLPLSVVEQMRDSLTKRGSVTNDEMHRLASGMLGGMPADLMPRYPMAVASRLHPYTGSLDCIGWASATLWDRTLCLQAFVAEDYRRMGLASALASALIVDGHLTREMPLGVFSDEMVRIAQRLGFQDIQRYRRCDDGWLRSERLFDAEPRGVE